MGKLKHKNKTILSEMKIAKNIFSISKGLMFTSKKKIDKGMCLVLPSNKNILTGATITMLFCFSSMQIIFINTNFEVVDKATLKPWKISYKPKKPCKYVIESLPNKFKDIKIGDKIKIEF